MSRKALIITLIALILLLVGIGTYFYWQSFKTVTYNFLRDDVSVTVYKLDDDERLSIDSLKETTERRLQRGKYLIIPNEDTFSQMGILFEVRDKDMTVDINPEYSESYRRTLRDLALPEIQAALQAKYPEIIANYTMNKGEIFKEGQWYGTLLIEKALGSDEGDIYRTVLKKEGDDWIVKATPALLLAAKDYPDIPKEILSAINSRRPEVIGE